MLGRSRLEWPCSGVPGPGVEVKVTAREAGRTTRFAGVPWCNPAGVPLGVFRAAAQRNVRALDELEPLLRCDDDPILLRRPTPWSPAGACLHGLWTPHSEHLIRAAERARSLARIRARRLFPRDIGVLPCTIAPAVHGKCGVAMKDVWSDPTVSFVISWPSGTRIARHVWHVALRKSRVTAVVETGPAPPRPR
jgi:hypothetical protein